MFAFPLDFFRRPIPLAIGRRLVLSIPVVFIVSALLFLLLQLVPGDATQAILGPKGLSGNSPEQYTALAQQLGLNQPLYDQYWTWLSHAVQGDLGVSILGHLSVTQSIETRIPTTLSLVLGTLLVSLVVGVSLGVASAVRGGRLGRLVDGVSVLGFVVPGFWIAAELIIIFAVKLRWFPATGWVPLTQSPVGWLRSLALPVLALAALPIGVFAKYSRDGMLEALASEHVRMARANGVPWRTVVWVNALKPASLLVVTNAGTIAIALLSSTVLIESVFQLPGLGTLIVSSTTAHDVTMVQGVAVVFTLVVILVNLTVDILYCVLSPKVRTI
jgi:peptide/nickel transport system permease protein